MMCERSIRWMKVFHFSTRMSQRARERNGNRRGLLRKTFPNSISKSTSPDCVYLSSPLSTLFPLIVLYLGLRTQSQVGMKCKSVFVLSWSHINLVNKKISLTIQTPHSPGFISQNHLRHLSLSTWLSDSDSPIVSLYNTESGVRRSLSDPFRCPKYILGYLLVNYN